MSTHLKNAQNDSHNNAQKKLISKTTLVTHTMKPGAKGTGRFVETYGKQLVCVRYRRSNSGNTVFTTVELVVDQKDNRAPGISYQRQDKQRNMQWVAIRVDYHEQKLREQIKQKGARWDHKQKVWHIAYSNVVAMGLLERVILAPGS